MTTTRATLFLHATFLDKRVDGVFTELIELDTSGQP